ncbi:MAG: class I SAM-dependent methyltransferase [Kangiellaceae bacterium]|nr:class I SAM-dependent methyltransferase [Kangiellaceae bacterium]MCW8998342.1 class I SAM-dependent methyltransferase [Kangiellaceae bacterium]
MSQTALFWDKIADRYAARAVGDEDAYQKKVAKTQSYFNSDMQVLEFGCGTGSTALLHAPKVAHYTAIDISPKMIDIAKSKTDTGGFEGLEFKVATLSDYQALEGQYDAILGLSILHLLGNYQEVIQQVFQMLKPGGIFVTNTVCLNDNFAFLRFVIPIMQFFKKAPYVEFISRSDLDKSILNAGFEIDYAWVPPKSKMAYFQIARKPRN